MTHEQLMEARKAYADKLYESESIWKDYIGICDEFEAGRLTHEHVASALEVAKAADRAKSQAWADLNTAYGKYYMELEQ